jgi:hypothetical protein
LASIAALIALFAGASPTTNTPDPPLACHYQGGTYSSGAVLRMGRVEKMCVIVDGLPNWVRG